MRGWRRIRLFDLSSSRSVPVIDAELISEMDYRCLLLSATAFEFQFCGARGRKKWRGWARSVALQRAEEAEEAAAEEEEEGGG